MGPGVLAQVLRPLITTTRPNVLVGLQTSDDAAVYRLSDDQAIMCRRSISSRPSSTIHISTAPIAAANSMSDVFAMGGEVLMALNIAAFPEDLPATLSHAFSRGAPTKRPRRASSSPGGHTVTDDEPKYGLVVTGTHSSGSDSDKGGAKPGDDSI